ncbi:MAG: hypothetical protein ACP5GW_06960 [Caldisericaceae bacterium]
MMSIDGALLFIVENGASIIIAIYLIFVFDKKIDKLFKELKDKK